MRPLRDVIPVPLPAPAGTPPNEGADAIAMSVIDEGPVNTVAMGVPSALKPFVLAAGAQFDDGST